MMGKGTELVKNYDACELVYMNIGNIHALRDAFEDVVKLCQPWALQDHTTWLQRLDATQWLHHVQSVLSGACRVVEMVHWQARLGARALLGRLGPHAAADVPRGAMMDAHTRTLRAS